MSAPVQLLDWDSRFFGLKIGRLTTLPATRADLDATLERCRREHVDCLYALAPGEATSTGWLLEAAGFVARDLRLEFARALPAQGEPAEAREWSEPDVAALEKIAETAFGGTRFGADPNFPRESVQNLYRTWVRNSCHGFAQAVQVTGPAGAPQGFVTLHRDDAATARIGLIGVAEAHRSKRIGSRLVAAALAWGAVQGCREMRVVTQGNNVGAQRLYQRAGFTTVSASTWYHCWPLKT